VSAACAFAIAANIAINAIAITPIRRRHRRLSRQGVRATFARSITWLRAESNASPEARALVVAYDDLHQHATATRDATPCWQRCATEICAP